MKGRRCNLCRVHLQRVERRQFEDFHEEALGQASVETFLALYADPVERVVRHGAVTRRERTTWGQDERLCRTYSFWGARDGVTMSGRDIAKFKKDIQSSDGVKEDLTSWHRCPRDTTKTGTDKIILEIYKIKLLLSKLWCRTQISYY